jgi:hypothetical protein
VLLSLLLLFIDLIPFINNLSELVIIIAIPPVTLRLKIDFAICSYSDRGHGHYLILGEILLSIFDTNFSWPFCASFVVMSHCAAVGACALAVLSHLLLVSAQTTTVPCIVERLLLLLPTAHTLMSQGFFLSRLLIRQIPRCLLNILGHMG